MLNLFCKKEGGRGARAVWIIKNFWAAPPPPPFGQCLKENIFPRGVTNTLWYTSIYFGIPQRWTVSLPYKDLFSRWLSIFFSQENLVTHGQRHNFPHQYQHFDHMVIYPTMIWWHGWCWVLLSFFGRMSTLWSHWFDRICSGTKYSNQIWDGSINPSSLYKSGGHLEDRETYFNIWKWN